MPHQVKVTTADGKNYLVTLDEGDSTPVNPFEQMGARAKGGYNIDENAQQGVSGAIHGMMAPSPGQQLAMDALPFLAPGTKMFDPNVQASDVFRGMTQGRGTGVIGTLKNMAGNWAERMGVTRAQPSIRSLLSQDIAPSPAQTPAPVQASAPAPVQSLLQSPSFSKLPTNANAVADYPAALRSAVLNILQKP